MSFCVTRACTSPWWPTEHVQSQNWVVGGDESTCGCWETELLLSEQRTQSTQSMLLTSLATTLTLPCSLEYGKYSWSLHKYIHLFSQSAPFCINFFFILCDLKEIFWRFFLPDKSFLAYFPNIISSLYVWCFERTSFVQWYTNSAYPVFSSTWCTYFYLLFSHDMFDIEL